ncbi:hypothetical protein ACOSQ2_014495 [Xanthoceras sorbifolium]
MLSLLPIAERCCRDLGRGPNSDGHRAAITTTTASATGSDGEEAGTPLLAPPKKPRLKRSNQNDHPLLLGVLHPVFHLLLSQLLGALAERERGVDFDASAEQPLQRGMPGHSVIAGPAAFPSSSWALGVVAKEYLGQAPILYEEFLTRGLSQRIEEDECPDLCHTLVRHALLVSHVQLYIYFFLVYIHFTSCNFATVNSNLL